VWGFPLIDDDDPATKRRERRTDDVIRTTGRSTTSTLKTRRVALEPEEVTVVDGVPVLVPLRTLSDLAAVLEPDALVVALDHALHEGVVTASELQEAAAQVTNRPGTRAFRRAVQLADGRAESPLETLTRLILLPVLPSLRPQVEVRDRWGRVIARLDLADEDLRLGIESDGGSHRGRAADDRRRDAKTGYTIERCTWFDVRRRSDELQRRVLATASALRRPAA
jgi:very-short-patch-repair endonuclease